MKLKYEKGKQLNQTDQPIDGGNRWGIAGGSKGL